MVRGGLRWVRRISIKSSAREPPAAVKLGSHNTRICRHAVLHWVLPLPPSFLISKPKHDFFFLSFVEKIKFLQWKKMESTMRAEQGINEMKMNTCCEAKQWSGHFVDVNELAILAATSFLWFGLSMGRAHDPKNQVRGSFGPIFK